MSRLQAKAMRSPAFWVVAISFVVAIAANVNSEVANRSAGFASETLNRQSNNDNAPKNDSKGLLREDSALESIRGEFVFSNGRYEFHEESGGKPMKVLENLWLQRIAEAQKAANRKIVWTVDVTVTEFNQENFILVEMASRSR